MTKAQIKKSGCGVKPGGPNRLGLCCETKMASQIAEATLRRVPPTSTLLFSPCGFTLCNWPCAVNEGTPAESREPR